MYRSAHSVARIYLLLTLLVTLATSLIWGIDTLMLMNAGLSITEVFIVNSCFMLGQLFFEIPTGIVADAKSRKLSFMLGCVILAAATANACVLWTTQSPLILWVVNSILIGLGYTFFSGATEAWVVDAYKSFGQEKQIDTIFAWGQAASGIAMLVGSISGGLLAQTFSLGVPYLARAAILFITFIAALFLMHDVGFKPQKHSNIMRHINTLWEGSLKHGIGHRSVRLIMLTGPFLTSASFFTFYALQPYLLKLYGDPHAYFIAGLAAALVASSQIIGGLAAPKLSLLFKTRSGLIATGLVVSSMALFGLANVTTLWGAIALVATWGLVTTAIRPARQAYMHGLIPSEQRATIVSFDSMLSSGGSAVTGPILGRTANVWGFGSAYALASCVQLAALPFILVAKSHHAKSDPIVASKTRQ